MAKFTQDRMYEMLGDIYKSSTKKHAKKIGIDYLSKFARGGEPCPKGEYWNGTTCVPGINPESDWFKLTDAQKRLLEKGNNLATVEDWYKQSPEQMEMFKAWIDEHDAETYLNQLDPDSNQSKKFKEALDNDRQWNQEWYTKRKTLPQFKDVAERRLAINNQDMVSALKDPINLSMDWWKTHPSKFSNVPEVFYAPEIGAITRKNIADYNTDPQGYVEASYYTDANGRLQNSTITHEESHIRDHLAPQKNTTDHIKRSEWIQPLILDPLQKIITAEEALSDPRNNGYAGTYQQQPTEFRARLKVWRKKNGIDPLKNYTEEELKSIIDTNLQDPNLDPQIKELYETIKSDPSKLKFVHDSYVSNGSNKDLDTAEYGGLQKFIVGGASYQCPTGEYWNGVRCVPNYGVNPLGQSAINGFLSNTSTYNNAKIKELESKGIMYIKTQQQKDELNALYAKKAKIAEEDRKYNQKLQKEKLAKQRLLDEERNAQINPNKYYSETVQSVAGNKPSPTSGILSNFNFDVNNINFDAIEKRDREEAEKARLAAFEALSPEEKRKAIEAGFAEEDKLLDAKSKMYSQYFEDNKYYRPLSNAFASDNTEVFNPLGPSSLEQNRNNYFIKETEQEDFMMNEVLPFSKIKESHYKNVEKSKGDPKGDRYNEAIEAQNKWHQQNGPNPTYNGGEMFDYNKQNWEAMKHKFNDGYDPETKLYITPRGTYNPATKVYTPNRIGYQSSGAVEMLYPEQYAIGAMGARSALIPLGEMVYAKVGASALGQGIKAAWNTALPYTAGQLTVGNAVGLGFGAHGITTIKPNLDKFIAKPSLETGTDLAFSTVEVLGSPGVGNAIMAGVKPLIAVSKAGFNGAGALYNDIATGNSILPVAWKVDRPLINLKSSDYISRQFTAAEAALVSKYGKGMNLTPEEWIEMENLVNSGATDFTQAATPISRIPLYYNRSEAATKEAEEISKLKLWQSYATPTEKNIRTWSAGVPELYDAERLARAREIDKTRLVIPRKYTKNLGDNFTGMPYDDARVDFIHPEGGGFNEFASKENELMGNIPEGFRVIGKSKENGYNNIIIRPLKNTKTTSVTPASETVAPQSALNAEVSGSGVVADNTSLYKMGSDPNYEYTLLSSDEAALLKSENPNMTNVEILEELVVKGNPNSIYPSGQAGQQAAFEDAGNFAINWAVKDTGKYNEMLSNTTQVDQLTAKINRLESSPVVTKFKAINKSVTDEYRSQRNLTDDEFWVEYNADPAAYRAFASQKWSELMANDSTLSSTVKDYDLIQRSIKGLEAKLSIESENVAKLGEEAIDPIFKEKVIELYRQAGIPEDRIPKYAFINDGKLIRDFNIDRSKLVDMNQFDPLSEPSFAELSDADQMYLANNWQDIGGARTEDATITIGSRIKDKTYYTVRKLGEPQQVLKEVPAEKVIPWKPSTWKNYNAKPKNEITWERPYVEEPTLVEKASKITHDADYIAEVQAHEYGHDTELFYSDWGALTTEYDPTIAAYSSHSKNPLAKRFKDAMVEGKPFDPVTGKRVQGSWESSPNELHAELFRVRFKYYTKMAAENPQLSQKEIIKFMKEAEAADNAEVYDFYLKELSGHFKESTPITERKNLIKLLPALVPAISVGVGVGVGTSNGTNSETPQNKYGGNIKTLSKFIRK